MKHKIKNKGYSRSTLQKKTMEVTNMKRLIGYVITTAAFSPDGKHYSNAGGYSTIWKIFEKGEEVYSYEALRINVRVSEIPKTLYGKKVYSSEDWYLERQKY